MILSTVNSPYLSCAASGTITNHYHHCTVPYTTTRIRDVDKIAVVAKSYPESLIVCRDPLHHGPKELLITGHVPRVDVTEREQPPFVTAGDVEPFPAEDFQD